VSGREDPENRTDNAAGLEIRHVADCRTDRDAWKSLEPPNSDEPKKVAVKEDFADSGKDLDSANNLEMSFAFDEGRNDELEMRREPRN
jgi:hypothetical protein